MKKKLYLEQNILLYIEILEMPVLISAYILQNLNYK